MQVQQHCRYAQQLCTAICFRQVMCYSPACDQQVTATRLTCVFQLHIVSQRHPLLGSKDYIHNLSLTPPVGPQDVVHKNETKDWNVCD